MLLCFRADKLGSGDKIVLDPMVIFYQAVENVKPSVTTQVIKKGGRGYHVSLGKVWFINIPVCCVRMCARVCMHECEELDATARRCCSLVYIFHS